jgi:hypothetical protein
MRRRTKITLIATTALLVAYGGLAAVPPASAAPVFAVAPYVDMTLDSADSMIADAVRTAGLNSYTAAFIIGAGCSPWWGGTGDIDTSVISPKIARAESAGARTIISFGGAQGAELAQSCTSLPNLVAAYQRVITKFHVTHLDFDIEGAGIADTASNNRRFQAINTLRSRNPGLVVSLTIPVLESGPDFFGEQFLGLARSNGTRVDVINAMTMDYGHPNGQMGQAAITAAQGTLAAARRAGLNLTMRNIGITPMIGQNDTPNEIFNQANADEVLRFASANGVGRLAFWSLTRDRGCPGGGVSPSCSGISSGTLEFTRKFTGFTGSPPPPPPPPPSTSPPTSTPPPPPPPPSGTTTWAPNTAYAVGAVVTYQGVRYRCRQAHTSQVDWTPPATPALWLQI